MTAWGGVFLYILMHPAAWARLSGAIAEAAPGARALHLDAAGGLIDPDGDPAPADARPEVFWHSVDLMGDDDAGRYLDHALAAEGLDWMQTMQAGLDNPVFADLLRRGLRIAKSSAQSGAIAEYVLAHVLSIIHPIDAQRQAQAARDWRNTPFREISGGVWLLVGLGNIGGEIAKRARAFGARVVGVRRQARRHDGVDQVASLADLPRLLPQADVVVLCCALNEQTRHLADAGFFAAMKESAILVNVGRGGLLDEAALLASLDRGRPHRAGLDVFETEPLPADSPLWAHPAVRVSAHTSTAGAGTAARGDEAFLENLRRAAAGKPLRDQVDPKTILG